MSDTVLATWLGEPRCLRNLRVSDVPLSCGNYISSGLNFTAFLTGRGFLFGRPPGVFNNPKWKGHNMAHLQLAVRINPKNPVHHLFNNHGAWWCHFWIIEKNRSQQRVGVNLKTRDLQKAQIKRDNILNKDWKDLTMEQTQQWKTLTT